MLWRELVTLGERERERDVCDVLNGGLVALVSGPGV